MTMSYEDFGTEEIAKLPFLDLFREYQVLMHFRDEVRAEIDLARKANEMGELFANAAELGVIVFQLELIKNEAERRDAAGEPLHADVIDETTDIMLSSALFNVYK